LLESETNGHGELVQTCAYLLESFQCLDSSLGAIEIAHVLVLTKAMVRIENLYQQIIALNKTNNKIYKNRWLGSAFILKTSDPCRGNCLGRVVYPKHAFHFKPYPCLKAAVFQMLKNYKIRNKY